jgi:hypothetical protein
VNNNIDGGRHVPLLSPTNASRWFKTNPTGARVPGIDVAGVKG